MLREEELFVGNGNGFLCVERSGMREREKESENKGGRGIGVGAEKV